MRPAVLEDLTVRAIYIPHLLKAPGHRRAWEFEEMLPDLETLTPVRGRLQVFHGGRYLEVSAQAEGIVTLTCDRCLGQYNYRLEVDAWESIWLQPAADPAAFPAAEREVASEDLEETLPPDGHFDPWTWLYEQFCLELPQRQICAPDCTGMPLPAGSSGSTDAPDRRWAALEALRNRLPE